MSILHKRIFHAQTHFPIINAFSNWRREVSRLYWEKTFCLFPFTLKSKYSPLYFILILQSFGDEMFASTNFPSSHSMSMVKPPLAFRPFTLPVCHSDGKAGRRWLQNIAKSCQVVNVDKWNQNFPKWKLTYTAGAD